MAYYVPPPEKVGDTSPVSPTKLRPCVSCICYFVQALQSMKQIIHIFIRSVGSTTGVVASIMGTPEFKQIAY